MLFDRLPGWPNERQSVSLGLFGITCFMLVMAIYNPMLWGIEVFKVLIQAFGITGVLNLVAGFYFSANKDGEHNTAKAFEAITATAQANGPVADSSTIREGDSVTIEKA